MSLIDDLPPPPGRQFDWGMSWREWLHRLYLFVRQSVNQDFYLNISRGLVTGYDHAHVFGANPAVAATEAAIWSAGGAYVFPSSAVTLAVVSADAADTAAGTGLRTLIMAGLDADYAFQSEIVTLNGTTPVNSVNQYLRVFYLHGLTAGSGGENAGAITATNGGVTYGHIAAGDNHSSMAVWTVPAGYTAYLIRGQASAATGKDISGAFYARPEGGVFGLLHEFYTNNTSYTYDFKVPTPIAEKTDLLVTAVNSATSTPVSATFDLILVNAIDPPHEFH